MNKGYTLIELLVVVIMGLILSVGIIIYNEIIIQY